MANPIVRAGVITTVNEESTIAPLVRGLRVMGCDVVLVADAGSTDNTVVAAAHAGATVLALPRLPISTCLLETWRRALALGAQEVIQIDAGGSHFPSDTLTLVKKARLTNADIVVGSRFMVGSHYLRGSLSRRFGSRFAARMCNSTACGVRLSDWTSGYRYFNRNALDVLTRETYEAKMHGWQIEVLQKAIAAWLRIEEAPITYIAGRSSFSPRLIPEAYRAWAHLQQAAAAV